MPLSAETGTSTAGVRTPPMTLPLASLVRFVDPVGDDAIGLGDAGGMPVATHLLKAAKAACTTTCWGPLLIGTEQPRELA